MIYVASFILNLLGRAPRSSTSLRSFGFVVGPLIAYCAGDEARPRTQSHRATDDENDYWMRPDRRAVVFKAICRIDTPQRSRVHKNGGILPYVLRKLAK